MQLIISHKLPTDLELPIHYHHILQSIIYRHLHEEFGYSNFLHGKGYQTEDRQFRMFVFSLLKGKYEVHNKKITFRNEVNFEVRSMDARMIRILKESLEKNGIDYIGQHYDDLKLELSDDGISNDQIRIKMVSPLCVYSTDVESKKTFFYQPMDYEFEERVISNFKRKYKAYTGVEPTSNISISPVQVSTLDKYVTSYKNFYISGWMGEYELKGEPKYLDFLYQTGLGSKNSQGFGMFEVIK